MASLFSRHLSRWTFPMVKSLQSRNAISLRANLKTWSNIRSYNAVMNPISKTGLFVRRGEEMGENVALEELSQSVIFDCLIIWDVTKPRSLQKLEPKLYNEKCLNLWALICIVFLKMKGSAENTSVWVSLIFKSWMGFKHSIFCFCSFWAYCRVHNPPVTWWKEAVAILWLHKKKVSSQSHCSYIRPSNKQ